MTRKAENTVIIVSAICTIIILILIIISDAIGISGSRIEINARRSQKINDTWEVSKSVNEELAAMVFYNDTLDDYIFSIYVKRNGFSFGYFFRMGGSNGEIEDKIQQFTCDNKGSALISMNKDKVSRIDLYNGVDIIRIDIDPVKPFAVVIPVSCGSVKLYDANNNEIPITNIEAI